MMKMAYAYLDGAFLRERSAVAMDRVFNSRADLDFNGIRHALSVARVFYYDCVEDQPRNGETQAQFDLRTEAQRQLIASVSQAARCHVRLGTLKQQQGSKQITQKE